MPLLTTCTRGSPNLNPNTPKTQRTPLCRPRPNTLMPSLHAPRLSRHAAPAASLATPSTNGLCSPPSNASSVIPCVPPTCRRCAAPLSGTDPQPLRHQVWELPEIKPSVTEYQRHRLTCRCGTVTCGALPAGVPTGQAGPRLIAFSGLLMSCFRQSKRRAALFLSMILNQPACPGWMVSLQKLAAEAVQPAYDELVRQLPQQAVLYIDESPTKEGKTKSWIWTFVAATFTLFATRTSRAADILDRMAGKGLCGRHPLRPCPDVLVVRAAAMVLGASETRLPGADRQSLPHGSSPGP